MTTAKASEGDRRRRRQALVADAVHLSGLEPNGRQEWRLALLLAKKHKLTAEVVLAVLREAPELSLVGYMIKPKRHRGSAAPDIAESAATGSRWADLQNQVVLWLSELETDAVHLRVESSKGGGLVLELRVDFLFDRNASDIWIAALVKGDLLWRELAREGPVALGPGWTLPPRVLSEQPDLPAVLVWQVTSSAAAGSVLTRLLQDRLKIGAERVQVDRECCSPVELDKRLSDSVTLRRLQQKRGRKHAIVASCDRCGQPLSDPDSVALGIGPECRKFYSKEVLAAVRSPQAPMPRRGGKSQRGWRDAVIAAWGENDLRRPLR